MPLKVALTADADADLTDIYRYTYATFGKRQAEIYLLSFDRAFARIADFPEIGTDASRLRAGYRRLVHERHAIFYRRVGEVIEIVRVLHVNMRAVTRL